MWQIWILYHSFVRFSFHLTLLGCFGFCFWSNPFLALFSPFRNFLPFWIIIIGPCLWIHSIYIFYVLYAMEWYSSCLVWGTFDIWRFILYFKFQLYYHIVYEYMVYPLLVYAAFIQQQFHRCQVFIWNWKSHVKDQIPSDRFDMRKVNFSNWFDHRHQIKRTSQWHLLLILLKRTSSSSFLENRRHSHRVQEESYA